MKARATNDPNEIRRITHVLSSILALVCIYGPGRIRLRLEDGRYIVGCYLNTAVTTLMSENGPMHLFTAVFSQPDSEFMTGVNLAEVVHIEVLEETSRLQSVTVEESRG